MGAFIQSAAIWLEARGVHRVGFDHGDPEAVYK